MLKHMKSPSQNPVLAAGMAPCIWAHAVAKIHSFSIASWQPSDGDVVSMVKHWEFLTSHPGDIVIYYNIYPGWWFGTWILWLSIYWECHHPRWRTHIFQRGRYTTNHIYIYIYITCYVTSNMIVAVVPENGDPSKKGWNMLNNAGLMV